MTADQSDVKAVDNSDVQLALDEMRTLMDRVISARDGLDQKANNVVVAAAMLLTIATTLQVVGSGGSPGPAKIGLVALATVLFIVMMVIALAASSPTTYTYPVDASLTAIRNGLLDRDERAALKSLLQSYVKQINGNAAVNNRKAWEVKVSSGLLGLIIVVLVIAAAVK